MEFCKDKLAIKELDRKCCRKIDQLKGQKDQTQGKDLNLLDRYPIEDDDNN